MIAGRPAHINVYANWYDDFGTDPFDMTETFAVYRNAANNGYNGASSQQPPRLIMLLDDLADLEHYDFTLQVDLYGWILQAWTWFNVPTTFRPPWGTSLQIETFIPLLNFCQFRALA